MRFTGRDSSCDTVKRLSSTSPMKKKNTFNQKEDELCTLRSSGARNESPKLHTARMGLVCKPRKKVAAVFPQSSAEEEVDLDKEFDEERCFDDNDMWLSSDYAYVSLENAITLFSGSRINSNEETSLALERTIPIPDADKIFLEELRERNVVSRLLSSTRSDSKESSVTCSKSAGSSCRQLGEDSTSCDSSSTPLSTNLESSTQTSDSDRTSDWVSLVNLDGEDSNWISDTEAELDYFQSGFPSPSFRSSWGSEVLSSNSSSSSLPAARDENSPHNLSSDCVSEAADLEDLNADEPLFWPFERKFDWSSEKTWDCFSMSPRKDTKILATPERTPPRFIELKLHGKKSGVKEGCRRRLVLGSGSTASNILNWKQKNDNKGVRIRSNTKPSRLSKSTKVSMKIVPLDVNNDILDPKDGKTPSSKSVAIDRSFLEEDFASNEELPIEILLGLHEFDGHEGVDSEFNETMFSLDESL